MKHSLVGKIVEICWNDSNQIDSYKILKIEPPFMKIALVDEKLSLVTPGWVPISSITEITEVEDMES